MRITLLCVGRLGSAPEAKLALDWAARATATGRPHGVSPVDIVEVESRKPGKAAEADKLLDAVGDAWLIACDEHGRSLSSREFCNLIGTLRDEGHRRVVFMIGGADGLDERILSGARESLAMGKQTWPHALVRAMLAEQIYRATTLMAGAPYHRD